MSEDCLIVVRRSAEFLPMRILNMIQRNHPKRLQVKYKTDLAGVNKLLESNEYDVRAILLKSELEKAVYNQLLAIFINYDGIDLYVEGKKAVVARLDRKTGKYKALQ